MMEEFEVDKILEKRMKGKKQEYLLQWKTVKRPTWVPKENLCCDKLLMEFESSHAPQVLGAMRESDGVRYLVKFKGENEAKAISSAEATKYPVPIIEFLQSKIIWENDNQDSHSLATISQMQGVPTKCIYATKEKDTLLYFLELEKGAVNIISAEEAITSYAAFVLNYLESCIE